MTDRPDFSPVSLLHTLWTRKFSILAIWALVTAGVIAAVRRLPAVYKAEAVVLVESQRIPEKYVPSTVNADLQERLNTISQQILSSSQLWQIIEKFNLYPEARKTLSQDEIVQRMRSDIGISIDSRWRKDRPGAFRISYIGSVPTVVSQVANYISGLFIDENIRTRESQAEGTSQFLEDQLAQAKARLEEQESKLSEYKMKYNGELPQQENTLAAALGQFQMQLQGLQESISRTEQQKLMLENAIESARTSLDALSQTSAAAAPESLGPNSASPAAPAEKRSDRLRAELDALRMRYTEDHPDIKLAKAELARELRQEAARAAAASPPAAASPQEKTSSAADLSAKLQMEQTLNRERERVENLEVQLKATAKDLDSLEAERRRVVQSISAYQARIERLPIREQQLAAVSRDYEISKATYRSLLDKKLAANVAADMERRQQPERFTMLEAAKAPERPLKPDRLLLSALGSVLGLFLGVTFAVGAQVRKNVLLGEWELPAGVWVLGRVPTIDPNIADRPRTNRQRAEDGRGRQPKTRWVLAFSTILLMLGAMAAAGIYFGWV
ncbi:MAG TPA: GNVR domain-containing protein [Bryobacterales bacterium]|nr:GNVR domain-containing protein [Bryobacterales bacterium]